MSEKNTLNIDELEKVSGGYSNIEAFHTYENFVLQVTNEYKKWLSDNKDASEETKHIKLDEIIEFTYNGLDEDTKAQVRYIKENYPTVWNNFINNTLA